MLNTKTFVKETKPPAQVEQVAQEANITTSDYRSVVTDIRKKLDAEAQREQDRVREFEKMK